MFGRQKIAMLVAEFVGTFTLASVILATDSRAFPFFAAVAAGLAVTGLTLAFGSASTGHFNPAITIATWTTRKIATTVAIATISAQMLGGVVAWTLNEWLLQTTINNITTPKLDWRIFTAEAIGAALLAMVVASAAYQAYTGLRNAVTVGLGLTLGILVASFAGNGLINPAVAVGIQSVSFVYIAGPILGALVGMNLYVWLFTERPKKTVKTAVKSAVKKVTAKKKTTKKGK